MRAFGTKPFNTLLLLSALFVGSLAYGQSSSVKAGTSTTKATKSKKNSEDFKAQIDFDVQSINYAEASTSDSQSQQRVQLGLNFKKEGRFFTNTQIIVGTFSEPNSAYYAFPEAYLGYGDKEFNVTAGRKKENLSFADSFFNLGLMQGHFTNDNVYFMEEGLTGISAHIASDNMGFMASFNPIFIPNQAPQARAEDGKIVSWNRWTAQAPAKFKFGDQYKNINYAITDYQLTDIVSHSGYVLNAYFGKKGPRPILVLTMADKPLNDIVLSRDTYSDISNFQGYVTLTPLVLNHKIQAADLNLDAGIFRSTLSALTDQPENQQANDQEYIQTLSPLRIYSVYAAVDLSSYVDKKLEIYTGTAMISGGEIKDVNSQGVESSFAISNSRTLYKQPVIAGVKSEMFFIYNEAVEADVRLTYDQKLKGSLLSANFMYAPTRSLKVNLGADLIGVENELPADAQGNFLDQNKANDRVFAGLNYVF